MALGTVVCCRVPFNCLPLPRGQRLCQEYSRPSKIVKLKWKSGGVSHQKNGSIEPFFWWEYFFEFCLLNFFWLFEQERHFLIFGVKQVDGEFVFLAQRQLIA